VFVEIRGTSPSDDEHIMSEIRRDSVRKTLVTRESYVIGPMVSCCFVVVITFPEFFRGLGLPARPLLHNDYGRRRKPTIEKCETGPRGGMETKLSKLQRSFSSFLDPGQRDGIWKTKSEFFSIYWLLLSFGCT